MTIEFLKPFQERVRAIDDGKLNEILEQGRGARRINCRPDTGSGKSEHGFDRREEFRVQSLDCRFDKDKLKLEL